MEMEARIEPGSLRKLIQASREWDAKSRREMRAGLRTAAGRSMMEAKASVMGPPPPQEKPVNNRHSTGLRTGLAAGVGISIQSGRVSTKTGQVTGEGVRVTTASKRLPERKAPMVKAYMAKEFRHPVFAKRTWYGRRKFVSQRGKDWFYGPLFRGRDEYQKAVVEAITKATQALGDH